MWILNFHPSQSFVDYRIAVEKPGRCCVMESATATFSHLPPLAVGIVLLWIRMPKNLMGIHVWMRGRSTSLRPRNGMVVTIISQSTFHVALAWFCTTTVANDMICVGYIMCVYVVQWTVIMCVCVCHKLNNYNTLVETIIAQDKTDNLRLGQEL